jgi:hypothetical protein
MRTISIIAAAFALIIGISAARGEDGISAPELDALVKSIEANAELWLEGKGEDISADKKLKAATYDAKSTYYLKLHLTAPRKEPINLYVANKLLQPMLMARPEVIRLIVPIVANMQAVARVKQFVQFPPDKLGERKMPQYKGPVPAEKLLNDLAELEMTKERKKQMDSLVAKHSSQVAMLTLTTAKLMLYAETTSYDTRLLGLLAGEERAGNATFLTVLDTIRAEAPKMDERRAKDFYEGLKRLAGELRATVKTYTDYTKPVIVPTANSHFETVPADKNFSPCTALVDAVNQFAPRARMPAIKAPSPADIAAEALLTDAKRLLTIRTKESFEQAKAKLAQLIKSYPGTDAAKVAEALLKRYTPRK